MHNEESKSNFKVELMGNFGRMHGLLSCDVCFFSFNSS